MGPVFDPIFGLKRRFRFAFFVQTVKTLQETLSQTSRPSQNKSDATILPTHQNLLHETVRSPLSTKSAYLGCSTTNIRDETNYRSNSEFQSEYLSKPVIRLESPNHPDLYLLLETSSLFSCSIRSEDPSHRRNLKAVLAYDFHTFQAERAPRLHLQAPSQG